MLRGRMLLELDLDAARDVRDVPELVRPFMARGTDGVLGLSSFKRAHRAEGNTWRAIGTCVEYGPAAEAECVHSCGGPSPRRGCSCGFYALTEAGQLPNGGDVILHVVLAGRVHVYDWYGGPALLVLGARQFVADELPDFRPLPSDPRRFGGVARWTGGWGSAGPADGGMVARLSGTPPFMPDGGVAMPLGGGPLPLVGTDLSAELLARDVAGRGPVQRREAIDGSR